MTNETDMFCNTQTETKSNLFIFDCKDRKIIQKSVKVLQNYYKYTPWPRLIATTANNMLLSYFVHQGPVAPTAKDV